MKWIMQPVVGRWLKGAYGIIVEHCNSCHDYDDLEYFTEIDLNKGRHVMGCCGMWRALERQKEMKWKQES